MRHSSHQSQDGQGLVEYGLILTLVAVVVIAVMMVLGPKIGNVFSTINASMAGGSFTFAASENGTVSVPSGTHTIQYGANGHYFTQSFTGPTTVSCSNSTFGDPIFGSVKSCSIQ